MPKIVSVLRVSLLNVRILYYRKKNVFETIEPRFSNIDLKCNSKNLPQNIKKQLLSMTKKLVTLQATTFQLLLVLFKINTVANFNDTKTLAFFCVTEEDIKNEILILSSKKSTRKGEILANVLKDTLKAYFW